jgi:hypothetical protein
MPYQEFLIDKITNCIEEKATGRIFATTSLLVTLEEIKKVHKKDGWLFNWKTEYQQANHQIYKLSITGNQHIQGLISLEPIKSQQYIELHLIESAPHNYGAKKQFLGVLGNLVAFACKMSFELGFDGFVAFTAKTRLIDHYTKTLGARILYGNNRMGIFTKEAKNLVNSYYENYFDD